MSWLYGGGQGYGQQPMGGGFGGMHPMFAQALMQRPAWSSMMPQMAASMGGGSPFGTMPQALAGGYALHPGMRGLLAQPAQGNPFSAFMGGAPMAGITRPPQWPTQPMNVGMPMGGLGGGFMSGRPGWPAIQGPPPMQAMGGMAQGTPPRWQNIPQVGPPIAGFGPRASAPMNQNPMAGRLGSNFAPRRSIFG